MNYAADSRVYKCLHQKGLFYVGVRVD